MKLANTKQSVHLNKHLDPLLELGLRSLTLRNVTVDVDPFITVSTFRRSMILCDNKDYQLIRECLALCTRVPTPSHPNTGIITEHWFLNVN